MIRIAPVAPGDDLGAICFQVRAATWGKDNEMSDYDPDSLKSFLADDKNILILAWDDNRIAGIALCFVQLHPSSQENTLYVHELDTHPDYRRQGIGSMLMKAAFEIAKSRHLSEVWVAADTDNVPANTLYQSLDPDDIDPSITYAYKVK